MGSGRLALWGESARFGVVPPTATAVTAVSAVLLSRCVRIGEGISGRGADRTVAMEAGPAQALSDDRLPPRSD